MSWEPTILIYSTFNRISKNIIEKLILFKRNGIFSYICLILFFWYANNPDFLERKFFVNEFFSLSGFFLFLSNPILYKKDDYLYNTVIAILCIFSVYSFCSLLIFDNFYGYLRHTVLFYSIFSFFLGIRLYKRLSLIRKRDFIFLSALFPSNSFYRTSYAATLPLYFSKFQKTFNWKSLVTLIAIMIGVKIFYGGMTAAAITLLILSLNLIKDKWKLFITLFLIGLVVFFLIYMKPYLSLILKPEIKLDQLKEINYIFALDGNSTIRFFMWSYLFFEVFVKHPFGIGLGTTMLPKNYLWDDLRLWLFDPHIEYTIGAHNSFITILVRFGILGIIPFVVLYWKLIGDFIKDRERKENSNILFYYYSFFIITGCAMVNVVIESPIHSSLFWGILGILYQAKQSDNLIVINNIKDIRCYSNYTA